MYEDGALQSFFHSDTSPWWTVNDSKELCRGRLLMAFVPHTDQIPNVLIPESRSEATIHNKINYRIEEFSVSFPLGNPKLPTAALHDFPGERHFVYRAKKRPVVVVSLGGPEVPKNLRPGTKPKWQTSPTMLVAPYYGSEKTDLRAGWHGALVERIQRCEYPQYMWEKLPVNNPPRESILKLDHIQSLGSHYKSYEMTDYVLCDNALDILDDWLLWLTRNELPLKSNLYEIREELLMTNGINLAD
ncbi:MAG: hypothetical protein A2511_17900 [Deltaproteobacteria bacterium RIFOXYD12_FULL_50_9]|nr:MAG: hypothetical protein A2511_17900 [Deltaproteobacteria bacterium RIFOXYD12_FULL_50_9]